MKEWHKSRTFLESCRHAFRGIQFVFLHEPNLRRQVYLGVAALALGAYLRLPASQLALIVLVSTLIFVLEMINTALERIEDLLHPEYHEAIRHSKDAAAGAVMVASLSAIVVAVIIFGPPLANLVS